MKTGIFSRTTTIHNHRHRHRRFSPAATSHCLLPSTRNVNLRHTGFECKAVSKSPIHGIKHPKCSFFIFLVRYSFFYFFIFFPGGGGGGGGYLDFGW
ncbi:hypothetical protein Hanom_Chr15g01345841 [Helianthus anomalus]